MEIYGSGQDPLLWLQQWTAKCLWKIKSTEDWKTYLICPNRGRQLLNMEVLSWNNHNNYWQTSSSMKFCISFCCFFILFKTHLGQQTLTQWPSKNWVFGWRMYCPQGNAKCQRGAEAAPSAVIFFIYCLMLAALGILLDQKGRRKAKHINHGSECSSTCLACTVCWLQPMTRLTWVFACVAKNNNTIWLRKHVNMDRDWWPNQTVYACWDPSRDLTKALNEEGKTHKWELKLHVADLLPWHHPLFKGVAWLSSYPLPLSLNLKAAKASLSPQPLNRFLCFPLELAPFPTLSLPLAFSRGSAIHQLVTERGRQGSGHATGPPSSQPHPLGLWAACNRTQPSPLKRQTQPHQLTPVSFSSGHDYRQVTAFSVQKLSLLCPQPGS